MKIVAISAIPSDLEIVCLCTLSKYHRDGHEVHIITTYDKRLQSLNRINVMEAVSEKIGISVHNVEKFDYSAVTQKNVNLLNSLLETINPSLVIIPFNKSNNPKRKILAQSSLIAARKIRNILMYEVSLTNAMFVPNVYLVIPIQDFSNICQLIVSNLRPGIDCKNMLKKMKSTRMKYSEIVGDDNMLVEAFRSHKIMLINDLFD